MEHQGTEPRGQTTGGEHRLRRVLIEDRQQKALDHARQRAGYAEDVAPDAHDPATFRLINQRKELDALPHAGVVVQALDEWKHWQKMRDWDSRNRVLKDLISKLRRREASTGEVELLIVLCRPSWAKVRKSLRRYGGADLDPGAKKAFGREEVRRVNNMDRAELDEVVHNAFFAAVQTCPSPFPRRFFPWLTQSLLWRALDHIRADLQAATVHLPHDHGISEFLDAVMTKDEAQSFFRGVGSPGHAQWVQTLDLPALFELADEYAVYARTQSACERAVEKLPARQRQVIRDHYYGQMTKAEIARTRGVASSTIRNTHDQATKNLRSDDELFDVLEAIGAVRDAARRSMLTAKAERVAA